MAKIAVLTDTNQLIGNALPIPDTAIPDLRIAYGGTTNAETANNFLAWVKVVARKYVSIKVAAAAIEVEAAAVNVDKQTAIDGEVSRWP